MQFISWCVEFLQVNLENNLHFISLLHIEMSQVIEIYPHESQEPWFFYTINIIAADGLGIQGDRASAALVLSWFSLTILTSTRQRLIPMLIPCITSLSFVSCWVVCMLFCEKS